MNYYTYELYKRRTLTNEGQNKKRAIARAKIRCIEQKESIVVAARTPEDKEWTYIGIAEFPYYLRELRLDPRDIHFNYFD